MSLRPEHSVSDGATGRVGVGIDMVGVSCASPWQVFMMLGVDSHRYMALLLDVAAKARGVRLLCLDRPGRGRSSDYEDERYSSTLFSQVVIAPATFLLYLLPLQFLRPTVLLILNTPVYFRYIYIYTYIIALYI